MDHAATPGPLDPLAHVARDDHPDAIAEARARAARALRDIGHELVGHAAPLELLDEMTATLISLAERLAAGDTRSRGLHQPVGVWESRPADGDVMTSYEERPVSGRSSPWGLDLEVRREGDDAVARLTLRAAHEGAPGRSHGGIVAALFDDVFGFVLTIHAQPAFTGEITVRYRAGTPVGRPLECRVRLDRRDGRKLHMSGELLDVDTGTVVATSHAVFIAIEADRFSAGAVGASG